MSSDEEDSERRRSHSRRRHSHRESSYHRHGDDYDHAYSRDSRHSRHSRDRDSDDHHSRSHHHHYDDSSSSSSGSSGGGGGGAGDSEPQALFVGNLDDAITRDELTRAFEREGGHVNSVDIKQGFAFVYMADGGRRTCERLNGTTLGRRRIHVEFARNTQPSTHGTDRRVLHDPCETLFIANLDANETEIADLCSRYGEIVRVSVRRNFCFVEFRHLDDAVAAQRALAGSFYGDRRLTVDFAQSGSGRGGGGGGGGGRFEPRDRSRSPITRERGSPTYSPYSPNRP